MTPQEFEQQVTRIINVIEGKGAKVTWDKHIADPDNPEQQRQIDIEVIKGGKIIHVECRHRASPQDVTWIEALVGRRDSLNADCVIGVSSSGFTLGAKRKAKAKNIILRDLASVNDLDVFFWVGDLKFSGSFFKLKGLELAFHTINENIDSDEMHKEIDTLLEVNSPLWQVLLKFFDQLSMTKLRSDLLSGALYQVMFDVSFGDDSLSSKWIKSTKVKVIANYIKITAERLSQSSFREYNGESIVVDAVVEDKIMPKWEIEIIQTKERIGLLFERDDVGVEDNSFVTSTIKIDHGDITDREFYIGINSPQITDCIFDFEATLNTPNGQCFEIVQ